MSSTLARHWPSLALLALMTIGFAVVLAGAGPGASQVGRVYLLAAGALVLLLLLLELRRAWTPGGSEGPAQVPQPPRLPAQLEMLQDTLRASRTDPKQYRTVLVPLFREVAQDRLALLGITLDGDRERAQRALGPELAPELLRDPSARVHRLLPLGPTARELERLVARLEELGR